MYIIRLLRICGLCVLITTFSHLFQVEILAYQKKVEVKISPTKAQPPASENKRLPDFEKNGPPALDTKPRLVVQLGHRDSINSAVFSPDGKYILTGSSDNTACLWDVESGKELRKFGDQLNSVNAVRFSPDGKYVFTGSDRVRMWETQSGRLVRHFEPPIGFGNSLAVSPDGKYLLYSGHKNWAFLLAIETGKTVKQFHSSSNWIQTVEFSPDGKVALFAGEQTIEVWQVETGQLLRQIRLKTDMLKFAVLSRDGKYIWTASDDESIELYDVKSGKKSKTFEINSITANCAAFSPDGKYLLIGNTGEDETTGADLWEIATGELVKEFVGHTKSVNAVAFSPDGKYVLTGSDDCSARLWGVESGDELRQFTGYSSAVTALAFSPTANYLLIGNSGIIGEDVKTAHLWNMSTGREVKQFEGELSEGPSPTFPFQPNNNDTFIKRLNKTMSLFNAEQTKFNKGNSRWLYCLAVSPDGKYLLTGKGGIRDAGDNSAQLWNIETGEELKSFYGDGERVISIAFSPDGKYVLTGSGNFGDESDKEANVAQLWDIETEEEVKRFEGHRKPVNAVAFSPDGKYVLTGSDDHSARLWNVKTAKEVRQFRGHTSPINSVAFSPDGRLVLTGSGEAFKLHNDNQACLWDTLSGKQLRSFPALSPSVSSAIFSPDGQYVLTCNSAGLVGKAHNAVQMWSVQTGKEVRRFSGLSTSVNAVVMSPDGKYVFAGGDDYLTMVWDASTGKELCRLLSFQNGDWVVVDSVGRFDTNNLEEVKGLHWIMPDDPLRPLPLEIFMRDYYEPRLLPRILRGERFSEPKRLSEVNRAQPKVEIVGIEKSPDSSDSVTVTVKVSRSSETFGIGDKRIKRETEVYDLRLFRNGQIVGQFPEYENSSLVSRQAMSFAEELMVWRKNSQINLNPGGSRTIKFEKVKLPRTSDSGELEFSAYAFNDDRIKSPLSRMTYENPESASPVKGRAYVVMVGVNAYENSDCDLAFAANDVRQMRNTFVKKIKENGQYEEVVEIPLTSDYEESANGIHRVTQQLATKRNIKAVLDLLGGKPLDEKVAKGLPNVEKIRPAQPDDLVLIFFSGHGYADEKGNFFIVPYDVGKGRVCALTDDLLNHSINSEELSAWLKYIDGGEMLMIVDTCYAAAAVENKLFKPGPMGSRGLGQLAYDKGMKILASTQEDNIAGEIRTVGKALVEQGLLSYVLTREGIEEGLADFKPKDGVITISEWLLYSVERVPQIYKAKLQELAQRDQDNKANPLKQQSGKPAIEVNEPIQQPSLFDFTRNRKDQVLFKK